MRRIARFVALGYLAIVIVTALLQLAGVTRFAAPLAVLPTPQRPPIVVTIGYSSEQSKWITAAAQQFADTSPTLGGRPIQLVLRAQGSLSMLADVVQDRFQPTAIIPAGSGLLATLDRDWGARHTGAVVVASSGPNQPQPVALSPLVLVSWQERADLLFPSGTANVWQRLHDALTKNNWSDPALGGQQAWGPVKLGHTSPEQANSGIETLTLLAYAYHNKSQGLTLGDIDDPGFKKWLGEIEQGVTDFPESTDTLFNSFLLKGASAYDVAVVYESQIVGDLNRIQGRMRVLYPPATTWSDHPFVVLQAPWNSAEQQAAARMFRDFLLGEPAQRLARQYGFRPANANVRLDETAPDNPFSAAGQYGVQLTTAGVVAAPAPEILDELRSIWKQVRG